MNDSAPSLSVVMAVHNGRRYLAAAIESILAQTYRDFEFIIVDDGSTDGATEDMRAFAAADPRIRLIGQEHAGLTRALNTGLRVARGEFIARMDADDLSRPERFARQVAVFRADDGMVLVGAEVELITEDGLRLGPRRHPLAHDAIRSKLLRGEGDALTHPVVMFRRRTLELVGAYDEAFDTGQDLDLFLRFSEAGTVMNLPETLLDFRQHPESINRNRSETWASIKRLAIGKTLRRVGPERFAAEFFAEPAVFRFPSGSLALGKLALQNGRNREARKLFLRAARGGPHRLAAVGYWCIAVATASWRAARAALRWLAGPSPGSD